MDEATSPQVTMRDVAERAGVSMMTVSLALRGGEASRISEGTRQRVLEVARDLHYRPNARARALRSGQTRIIGLYAGYGFVNVRTPFFTEIVSGLQEGCEQVQRDLLLHSMFHGETPEDIFAELADGRIDGLVVQMAADNPLARRLVQAHLPVVAVADSLPGIPSVVVDDCQGAQLVAEHLHRTGYSQALYLDSRLSIVSALRRREAFARAAEAHGIPVQVIPSPDAAEWEQTFDAAFFAHWLSRKTAVVCWNDTAAYGMLRTCRHQGLRIPEDLGIVGFDGCPTPLDNLWSLTTIHAPWAEAARQAVHLLDALREGHEVPPESVLPVTLRVGDST